MPCQWCFDRCTRSNSQTHRWWIVSTISDWIISSYIYLESQMDLLVQLYDLISETRKSISLWLIHILSRKPLWWGYPNSSSAKFQVPSSKFRQVPPSSAKFQVPSSEFQVPSSKFQVPPSSAKFRQVPPSSAKFRQVPPSSAKFRQVPPSSAKFRQVPPSSAKFRQVPHISSSKFPSSQFIIIILDFIQFYSTSTEFYRIHSL